MLLSMRSPRLLHCPSNTSTTSAFACPQQQYSSGLSRRCTAPCRATSVANRSGEWTQVLELLDKAPVTPLPSASASDSDDATDNIPATPADRARLTRSLQAGSPPPQQASSAAAHNIVRSVSTPHASPTSRSEPAGPATGSASLTSDSSTLQAPKPAALNLPVPPAASAAAASAPVSAASPITAPRPRLTVPAANVAAVTTTATEMTRRLSHTQTLQQQHARPLQQQSAAQQQVLQQQLQHADSYTTHIQHSQQRQAVVPQQPLRHMSRQEVVMQAEALAARYSQSMQALTAPTMQRPRMLKLAGSVHGMATVKGPMKNELQDRMVSHTTFGPGAGVWDAYSCGPYAMPLTLKNSTGSSSTGSSGGMGSSASVATTSSNMPAHAAAPASPGPASSLPLPLAAVATAATLASFDRPAPVGKDHALAVPLPIPQPLISFAAVFDGHSGCHTAETAAARMPQLVAHDPLIWEALGQGAGLRSWDGDGACEAQAVSQRWNRIFHGLDSEILTASREEAWVDGSTAMAMLQVGRKLFVANAGDCRAVLCRQGEPLRMSRDHTPQLASERSRIEGNGGRIALIRGVWRVALPSPNGKGAKVCAVARGLGDRDFKEKGLISADPEVMATLLQPGADAFLILASDGVWGVVDDFEAVDVVKGVVRQFASGGADKQTVATAAAQAVVKLAQDAGSLDDISALVVLYDWK